MNELKTVYDIEEIKEQIKHIFPDAVRGSVCKSRWGSKRKQLHLTYWIASDTVGGLIIESIGGLFYFYNWNTNGGKNIMFAESDRDDMINRVKSMYDKQVLCIDRTVSLR